LEFRGIFYKDLSYPHTIHSPSEKGKKEEIEEYQPLELIGSDAV